MSNNHHKSIIKPITLSACTLLVMVLALMSTTVQGDKGQMLSGMTTWYPERLL